MDQADFRSLLATPRAGGSGGVRSFGAAPPKRNAAGETKEVFKKPEFKPRAQTGKNNKFGKKKEGGEDEEGTEGTGSEYRDRAAERRTGVDSDFSAAEKLLQDFKARGDGSDDKEAIDEQMKYLGGDAEHTILVSGLDHALLNRRKFELAKANEQSAEEVEATLDEIFEQTAAASSSSKVEPKKRSRDEMMSALKAARGGGGDSDSIISDEGLEKAKAAGRFVSIGKPSKKKVEVVEGGELKKRRKKKVKVESSTGTTAPITSTSTSTSASTLPNASSDSKPILPPPPPEEDFDDDIFGGVADYKGLGSDSDSDDDTKSKPSTSIATVQPSTSNLTTASYFDEDDSEETFKLSLSTAPSSVTNLKKASSSSSSSRGNNGDHGLEEGEEEEEQGPNMKLQGFSSAGPSIRELLAGDESAEREEKRQAKKLKYGGKGVEKEKKVYTEEEKSNRDHQQMMNHLEKQKKKEAVKE